MDLSLGEGFLIFIAMLMVYNFLSGMWKLKMVKEGMEQKEVIDKDGDTSIIWIKAKA